MKRFFVAFLCVILVFSFVGCGGQTEESEAPIEEEVEEIPFVEVNWQTLEDTVETADGFVVSRKVKVSPFVSSNESDVLQSLWNQIGGEGDCPTTTDLEMDTSEVPTTYTGIRSTMVYNHDEVLYAFGTLEANSLTDNFSITEDNPQSIYSGLILKYRGEDGRIKGMGAIGNKDLAPLACRILIYFSNGISEVGFTDEAPTLNMVSDRWGPVPFIVVIPNQHTPNNPNGDPATGRMLLALGVGGGRNYNISVDIEKYSGAGSVTQKSDTTESDYEVGKQYTVQTSLKVRKGPGTYYDQIKRSELSSDEYKNSEEGDLAALKKGSKVTCKEMSGTWMKISSGWICCKDGDEVLVK